MNYYNEHDPFAAAWLRQLIHAGLIPAGVVDERSIEDVLPNELDGYTQCHFFAGIGGWSRALQLAGIPSTTRIWTGSCPCQPFSTAGKGEGFADERHLWPALHHLIRVCRPPVVVGEQVASADGLRWCDLVQDDLEMEGYAFGKADLCAAGVGSPHIRQRLYWVGHSQCQRSQGGDFPEDLSAGSGQPAGRIGGVAHTAGSQEHQELQGSPEAQGRRCSDVPGGCGVAGGVGESDCSGRQQGVHGAKALGHRGSTEPAGGLLGLAHPIFQGLEGQCGHGGQGHQPGWVGTHSAGPTSEGGSAGGVENVGWASPLHGFWRDADWLFCRDGKWRPVEPASQRMANGLSMCLEQLRTTASEALKSKVNHASDSFGFRDKVLQAMRIGYGKTEIWMQIGRRIGFPEATILLSQVREFAGELGNVIGIETQGCAGFCKTILRDVLGQAQEAARPPQGWEFPEQLASELADALSKLSQESSRYRELVSDLSDFSPGPLTEGSRSRIGKLRGYGNAIVPQVAAEFLKAAFLP